MMNKYLNVILLFSILLSGCSRYNQIDFSSSDAFFSSLNDKEKIQKKDMIDKPPLNDKKKIKKKEKINKLDKANIEKPLLSTFSLYEKILTQKIGSNEAEILKIFITPSLKIKHGRTKNFQIHLKFCHLDLFFLKENESYIFRHFDIRPSKMSSLLDKKKCIKELNYNFTLIRDPK